MEWRESEDGVEGAGTSLGVVEGLLETGWKRDEAGKADGMGLLVREFAAVEWGRSCGFEQLL